MNVPRIKMRKISRLIIVSLITLLFSTNSSAQNYVFAVLDGSPVNTVGWNFQGGARVDTVTSPGYSEVLVCPINAGSGAVFYNQPINLSLCNKWKAEFDFRMFDGTGADGLAFCFLDVPPSGFVTGFGLGIPSTANGLKVCFDTWNNCIPFNTTTVHKDMPKIELRWGIGYDECNSQQPTKDNADSGISFIRSATYNHAKITYDDGNIGVYINDSLYLTGFQKFDYAGYLGFTASTGGYTDNHSIKNVIIYTQMPPSEAGANVNICPNDLSQLGAAASTGYLYSWSPSNGLSAANISNPTVQLDNHSPAAVSHVYYVRTSYNNNPGCASVDSVTVKVLPRPAVSFLMPEICLNDAIAQFTDSSYTNESSTLPFSYQWNFGDMNATTGNPNTSALANPSHIYSAAANYDVRLVVKTIQGCGDSMSKIFTVNGAIPKANFSVDNSQALCSNKAVEIKDASGVNFGNIIKVEIIWGDSTGVSEIDDHPVTGKTYRHFYPLTQTTVVTNYTIHYKAFSGITCIDEAAKLVSILPAPQVIFSAVPSLCVDASPFIITQATEITGLQGTYVYNGDGVDATGLFNPKGAGAGMHDLIYTFTAANTCVDSANQSITVWPMPFVNAGPDLYVLQGATVPINATATGEELQYEWTPSTYLGNSAILNPLCSPLKDIQYNLKLTGIGGCYVSDSLNVIVLKQPDIPNAFSPNNDGINDTWKVRYLETYTDCEVDIYNRYGQHIFHSLGYKTPWNGMYNGRVQPAGAYTYIINTKKHLHLFIGSVIIIR